MVICIYEVKIHWAAHLISVHYTLYYIKKSLLLIWRLSAPFELVSLATERQWSGQKAEEVEEGAGKQRGGSYHVCSEKTLTTLQSLCSLVK